MYEKYEAPLKGSDEEDSSQPEDKRRVQFSDEPQQYEDELRELDEEEMKACWYNREDTALVKADIIKTISKAKRCADISEIDDESHCLRGLEDHIRSKLPSENELSKRERQEEYVLQVLEEMRRLLDAGKTDPRRLRKFATSLSKPQRVAAIKRGTKDAREVGQSTKRVPVLEKQESSTSVASTTTMDSVDDTIDINDIEIPEVSSHKIKRQRRKVIRKALSVRRALAHRAEKKRAEV